MAPAAGRQGGDGEAAKATRPAYARILAFAKRESGPNRFKDGLDGAMLIVVGRPRVRATAGTAHPVVIVPPGLSAGTGLLEVEQLVPSIGYEHVLRAAVAELRLESQVPAIEFAPRDRRLVVDEVFSKVWLDGLPLEALKAGDQPYKLIAALAAAGGACVGRTELAGILSPARTDEGGPKMAKSRLLKAIAASMKAAGRTPLKPADVLRQETGGGGYRLCLSCWYRPASASR